MLKKNHKIFVAGHKGLVGSAVCIKLKEYGFKKIITAKKNIVDLTNYQQVEKFFKKNKPDGVFICAARVGGIIDNFSKPYEFIFDNVKIQTNIFEASLKYKVKTVVYMGSSCIYPKYSKIPITENQILSGKLEKTNDAYAIAKITGLKMADALIKQKKMDIRCFMPCSLFGIEDNYFDLKRSHFIPATIQKIHKANQNNTNLEVWGSGKPKREFMFANDLAENMIKASSISKNLFLKHIGDELFYNIGDNKSKPIIEIVKLIAHLMKFKGKIVKNTSYPDGTFDKTMSSRKITKIIKLKKTNFKSALKLSIESFYQKIDDKKY